MKFKYKKIGAMLSLFFVLAAGAFSPISADLSQADVIAPTLTVGLSPRPTSQSVTAGETDVQAVDFSFRATRAPITITRLTFTGHLDGDMDGGYDSDGIGSDAGVNIEDVVTSVSLYSPRSRTMISSAETFSSSGTVTFSGLDWTIPTVGTSRLDILINTSSSLVSDASFSIDIADISTDIIAEDDRGNTRIARGADAPNGGTSPVVAVTVESTIDEIIIAFDGPSSSDVAIDSSDASILEFTIFSYTDVEVQQLTFDFAGSSGILLNSTHTVANFRDLKLVDRDTGDVLMGPQDVSLSGSDTEQTFDFSDAFTIDAGTVRHLALTLDVANESSIVGGHISATLNPVSVTEGIWSLDHGTYVTDITPSVPIVGNTMTLVPVPFSGDLGTITVASSTAPVLDDAVIAGEDSSSDPLLVARYYIYATGEAFTVNEMQFENDSNGSNYYEDDDAISTVILRYPTSATNPDTLDGAAEVTLLSGVASFTGLNIAVPESVSSDENAINVEVYVTTNPITSTGAFSSGAQIEMDFDESDGFSAMGLGSGETVTDESSSDYFGTTADVDANEIALYQALPTFAYHSSTAQCSGSLTGSSTDKVYCFSVTATGGAIALYKLNFAASANLLSTGTGSGALGVASGWTITEYDSSGLVGSSLGSGTWASNLVAITFTAEEVVAEDTTAYYVVQAPITYTDSIDTSSLSVYLQQDTAYQASGSGASAPGNIVWSDRSATSHTIFTVDWTNGYKLETLPTTTLRSSEG
ncbi:MAG: hypothetical protein WC654_06650 [Patescibacteria group bacterium]